MRCLHADRACNPSLSDIFGPTNATQSVTATVSPSEAVANITFDYKSIIALVIFIVCVVYSRCGAFVFIRVYNKNHLTM